MQPTNTTSIIDAEIAALRLHLVTMLRVVLPELDALGMQGKVQFPVLLFPNRTLVVWTQKKGQGTRRLLNGYALAVGIAVETSITYFVVCPTAHGARHFTPLLRAMRNSRLVRVAHAPCLLTEQPLHRTASLIHEIAAFIRRTTD